jgi:photosystem II stability/assembly factor-like uncharacterized protein
VRAAWWAALFVGVVALITGCTVAPRTAPSEPSAPATPSAVSALASTSGGPVASYAGAPVGSSTPSSSPPVAGAQTTYRGPRAVVFPTASHGVLLALDCASLPGRCQVFTKVSDDGGLTWSAPTVLVAVSRPSPDPPWNGLGANNLAFTNADDGYAYGPDLYQTGDGGRTWRHLSVTGQVAAAVAAGPDTWLVMGRGCTDLGCTGWDLDVADAQGNVRRLPTQPWPITPPRGATKAELPTQLLRPDAATAYLTRYDGVHVTHDGGASWARASLPCQGRYDQATGLSAGSSTMLWAVCSGGSGAGAEDKQLWRSTNSGTSWQGPLPLESDGYSDQITAINADVAWRYGDRGNVLHTADGGRSWQIMLPDLFDQAYGRPTAFAALANEAWIFDPYGPYETGRRHMYITTDAGRSWRTITIASLSLTTAAPAQPGNTACTAAQMAVTLWQRQQTMAQPAIAVIFTNISGTPCTLYGYPGVAGLDTNGHQITQAYRTPQVLLGGAPAGIPTLVTLASGALASALIGGGANPINGETACPADFTAVLVTPPGARASTELPVDFPSCSGLAVTPVVPGPTGGLFYPQTSP